MDENEELDFNTMSEEELDEYISKNKHILENSPSDNIENQTQTTELIQPEVVEPEGSTETEEIPINSVDEQITSKFHEKHGLVKTDSKGYKIVPNFVRKNKDGKYVGIEWLGYNRLPRTGFGGALKDTGESLYNKAAPIVGVSDTLIDFVNFASADQGQYDIPKLPS